MAESGELCVPGQVLDIKTADIKGWMIYELRKIGRIGPKGTDSRCGRLQMKYVTAVWDDGGFYVDPSAYLAELPKFRDQLPDEAREFASDPAHYALGHGNSRCVKDLELSAVRVATDKSGNLVLEFAPNQWKHDVGLRISYSGVKHFSIDYAHAVEWMLVDTVLLDEILPYEGGGCTHEIALTDASITVCCEDLKAVWGDAG
ncbi:hypothetical protein [Streptomyces griseofuscus]|uniref:hypothetical protein n=1 Tax=Streptomyces griseofuscus TaxID=146922 RepID=UPI001FACCB87|nr:hypothetical protein [Streptomyces griseofuscus]